MGSKVECYLHLGAHRTGTSSFQLALDDNAALLRELGFDLAYPGRDGAPSGDLRLKLPTARSDAAQTQALTRAARAEIARHLTGRPRLILSEENTPGGMFPFFRGKFFPQRRARLRALRRALPGPATHVLYVLRSYDDLFRSAYRLRASDNKVDPFDRLIPGFLAMREGWPDLVQDVLQVLRPARLSLLDYRDRGDNPALMARLVPDLAEAPLTDPVTRVNVSLSDADLRAIQDRLHGPDSPWRDPPRDAPFAAFPETARAHLKARYETDLARLAARSDVTLISSRHPQNPSTTPSTPPSTPPGTQQGTPQ